MKGNEMKWTERKRKQKQPKIQSRSPNTLANTECSPYIVPNTFSNKESIAKEDSLHNKFKKFIYLPSTVEEGGVSFMQLRKFIICRMIPKEGGPIDFYPRCLKRHLLSKDVESFLKRLYLYGASLTTEVKALKTQGQMPLKRQLRLQHSTT